MAPQTALAAQLQQKLGAGAAAGSSINAFVANLKATGKHRASFLFSSKEASDMDPEAIFAMGSNAVLELARVDRRFAQYSDTLFGEAFQSYDRSLKTAEQNAQLDTLITDFLRLLSPHFLIKPAGKALEWLLYRYHVADYNLDELVACALPYHETAQFVRVCKLVQHSQQAASSTSMWKFLVQCGKLELPLDRASLVHQLYKQPAVLKFILGMVRAAIDEVTVSVPLAGFFAATMMAYLDKAGAAVNDNTIIALMPTLLSCLRAKEFADVQAAAYMILTKISELTAMTAEMTSALLSVIARHAAQPRHALLCMLSLVQKQRETINLLPEQAICAIEVYDDLPAMLNVLASKFDASQFLQLVLKGVLARKNFALLHELVDALHLDDMTIGSLVDATLDRVASGDLETDSEDSATIKTLFTKLQARHATVVDTVLKERLADASSMDSATTSSTLFNFITSAFRGTRHEFIEDAQTTLALGLCHPEAAVRRIAVAKVIATLNKGVSNNCSDAAFMSLALVNNLGSDDDMIVENVLRFERLVDVADPNELVRALVKLVQSRRALEIRQAAVAVLCSKRLLEDARNAALVDGALLRVVLTTEVDNKIAMTMTKTIAEASKDGLQSAVLSALASVQRSDNILEINRAMVYSIASSESIDTKSLLSIRTPLSILSLLERLSLVTQADEKLTLVKQILDQLDTSSAVAADRAASVDSSSVPDVEPILLGASSANAAYVAVYALRRIIVESIAAPAPIAWMSQDAETNGHARIMTHILDMCVRCNLMNSLRILLSTHAKDTTLTFLVSIWSDEACSTSLRLTTLEMTQQLLAFGVAKRVDFQVLLPSFLVGLASADSRMRSGVFTCMESVASIYASNKSKKKDKASLSVKADLKIFGASDDSFYGVHCGAKQSLLFLETSDVATLIRDLRGEREAVIADVNHLHKWVATYFNNPSKAVADTCSKVTFRAALLRILDPVDSKRKLKAVVPILSTLLPYLDALLADADCDTAQFELLCSVVRCFGASAASKKSYVEAIIALMKSMQTANTGSQTRSECLINEIVRSCEAMFEHVDQDQRAVILHTLLELVIALPGSLSVAINKLLVRLPMDSALVEGELRRAIDDLSKGSSSEQAAKKTSGTAVLAHALSSVTSIGELIQVKDNIANEEGLLLPLFETLGVLLLIMATPTEYTRQVLLGNILRLMERASAHGIELDESAFRVDLLIQMIRVTDNPQTHNHALLLLAAIGAAYPEKVLHNMMPVFTFMGASVLRQDDNYSFHVIQRTLETILPALVAKNRVGQDGAPSIRAVLEVFANALYHIPKHRRLRLFTILVSTLGPEKFLASVLELLLVRHAVVNPQPTSASGKSNIEEPVTAFCSSLLNQYEIPLQVCAFIEMVKSATSLTSAKMIGQRIQSRTVLSWLECIGSQLSDSFFLSRVAVADQSTMQQLYKQMMETVLTLLNGVQSISSIADADSKTKANAAQVMDASMVVIDKTLVLLTSVSFVEIMCGLIEHSSSAIRRKALSIVSGRLQDTKTASREDPAVMIQLLPATVKRIAAVDELPATKQTALLAVGLLCRLLGKNHPEPFVAFLATLVGPVVLQQDKDHEVKLSGFTCLAALIEVLGPRSLAHIGKFMPLLLNDAELVLATGAFEDVYITLSVLHTVVKTLPQFVSPYIGKILALLFDRRIHADGAASEEVQMTVEAVVGSLSSLVPARVLMPALFAAQQQTLIEGLASICRFYDLVGGVVAAMDRDTITAHYKQLFRFYLSAFDLRSQSSVAEELDENGLEIAERHIIDSFVRLVLKLNESMFKPLFLTMVDWATAAENESAQEDGDSETDTGARGYIFYKMVDELLGRLKSIFAPYYAYVLDHALQLLADYKEDGTWSPTWNYVMASFTKALRYDNDGLLSDDKLQSLVPVVVDQLSFAYDDAEEYAQRTATFVTPALLALIKSSPAVVKKLNHAVLMTTRHDDESVRFAALDAIQNFYELEEGGGLGEDLLQYLPETIPFLAEILEDGSERVEKKGRMVIAKIEGLLGESLHEHLRA